MYPDEPSGFTYPLLLAVCFICFSLLMVALNLNQIENIKSTVDEEFKNSISEAMIVYINDKFSSDHVAALKESDKQDLQNQIQYSMTKKMKNQYHVDLTIESVQIDITDTVYIKYNGRVKFKVIALQGVILDIPVKGRSKAQRFDL